MSEDGDVWRAHKLDQQEKRAFNRTSSTSIIKKWVLQNGGILAGYTEAHLRVNNRFDFWPGTGKYLDRETNKYGRGVFNLIKELDRAFTPAAKKYIAQSTPGGRCEGMK